MSWTSCALLHTNCVISADFYAQNVDVFNNTSVFIYALLMGSNCLWMIKIDRNMSQLWQIASKICNFNISALVGFIV